MKFQSLVLIMVLAVSLSCSKSSEPVQETDEARIKWEVSIDEIAIGDNLSKVLDTLGEPDEIALGDFYGDSYIYKSGVHNGLIVAINNIPNREKNVVQIRVKYPYAGMTGDSLGIGSNIESLHLSVGTSDSTFVRTDIWYYPNSKWMAISDEEDKITDIVVNPIE